MKRKYISLLIRIKLNISCSEFQSAAVQYTCIYVLWFIHSQWFIYSLNILTHIFESLYFYLCNYLGFIPWILTGTFLCMYWLWGKQRIIERSGTHWYRNMWKVSICRSKLYPWKVCNTFHHNLSFGIDIVEDYPWTILLLFSLSFTVCGHGMSNSNRQTCWLMQSMLCSSWRPARVGRLRHAVVKFNSHIVFCDGTRIRRIQIPWAGPGSTCTIYRPFSFSFGSLSPSFSFFNHFISPP